ncbi:hypothetical protein BVRB_5g107500 [Beta vulgaris subsp. vulgaris]|nr:hypothetical protein BVRB_5g107500 [Beta vulgaris subsp. vulgaris]
MVINVLLSWNDIVRQFLKENSAWCLHLRGINCQSDGLRAKMSVGTETCLLIGSTSRSLIKIG